MRKHDNPRRSAQPKNNNIPSPGLTKTTPSRDVRNGSKHPQCSCSEKQHSQTVEHWACSFFVPNATRRFHPGLSDTKCAANVPALFRRSTLTAPTKQNTMIMCRTGLDARRTKRTTHPEIIPIFAKPICNFHTATKSTRVFPRGPVFNLRCFHGNRRVAQTHPARTIHMLFATIRSHVP